MRYISCFSGIGGLEASHEPILFCEREQSVANVLRKIHPNVEIWPDICDLHPPLADVVAGGWPCQDLSIAGKQEGLGGARSGLLRELLRVAQEAKAETIVAENVTNLLKMRAGAEFLISLEAFANAGFPYIGWRVLNAREFGLPQNRYRLVLVASRNRHAVNGLFRDVKPSRLITKSSGLDAPAGFYWTAGTHSINYTLGYVPTIKIGSSLGIASPPAVHYNDVVRLLSPTEALKLQGFDLTLEDFASASAAYKAAGNAVARDIGRWVLDGLSDVYYPEPESLPMQSTLFPQALPERAQPNAGVFFQGAVTPISVSSSPRTYNLADFLDLSSKERLSIRAARGLLNRMLKSNQTCPERLLAALMLLR